MDTAKIHAAPGCPKPTTKVLATTMMAVIAHAPDLTAPFLRRRGGRGLADWPRHSIHETSVLQY
jgi:hypothetical protein